eukprot:scaffold10811_cov88-Skeletonema_marinoi.AAC.2
MMRRVITTNVTTAVLILFSMGVWPVASQEAARLRCQKSGCREGGGAAIDEEEPALIIQSPSDRVIPLVPWIIAFFVLRLAAQVIRQLIPIIRRTLPEVQEAVGHYYDSIVSIDFSRMIPKRGEINKSTAKKRRVKSSGRSVSSSNRSLGSLADLIDDTSEAQSSRGASLWYDNDSSSAGYSSAYTSYTTSDDDKSSAMESQSEFGLSVLSTSESSTDSTYNYNHGKYDDGDQSRGGESVVSKFLNYISEATPKEYAQQYQKSPQRRSLRERSVHDDDRRPSLDYKQLRRSHNAGTVENYSQSGNKSQSRQRRSTVDETNYPSYRSQVATTESGNQRRGTTESSNQRRRESSNAPESLLISQSPPSSGGVKLRKAAAKTKPKRQDHGNIGDNYDKTSKSSSTKRQQQQKHRHDREADKKSSGLHHHLSKFSSSNNKDDNENYSTMLSTVDLRSRATRDTSMYSESFVAN